MSIYDSVWKEKAETFQRERDEARARADGLERLVKLYGLLGDGSPIERAEQRGYERGVKAAEAAAWKWAPVCRCRHEIRALLDPKLSDPDKPG